MGAFLTARFYACAVHSPTILVLAAILATLVTTVLYVVWHFNKSIPGLRCWTWSFLSASVFCTNLLVREHLPEVLAVVLTQTGIALAAYFTYLGSRLYVGRSLPFHGYAVAAIAAVVGLSVYFTLEHSHTGIRFALSGVVAGVYFIATAVTLARGGMRTVPARYLFAVMVGAHGAFVLLRPLLFRLATNDAIAQPAMAVQQARLVDMLSQYVVLEATVALVMMAFGILMLTNEHITTELRHLAEVDPLTSVFNRRAFLTLLDKAISLSERNRQRLPVLLLDLDHFKQINDTWGHGSGDDVLRRFVALAQTCLRKGDVMGRLGGEEFAIFLPHADGAGAYAVAERLRSLVQAQPVQSGCQPIALTVSIGVALCVAGDSASAAIKRADAAMYLAKQNGRNRVEWAQVPDTSQAPPTPQSPQAQTA